MITPSKRYFVAQTPTSKRICICGVEEIAALLNANKIQEDNLAREWTCPSSDQMMTNGDAPWVTIAQLLAAAYKDKPLVTVVLKDVENNTLLISERYHSNDGPRQVALGAAENYFDQHFKEFAKTPAKQFLLYFKADKCPLSVMTFKLKVESHTVYKGIIGSKEDPSEETFPCEFVDYSSPHNVEPPDEFPSVAFELKPPKYDPTAYISTAIRPA
jgi:hypothetical protein